jgi:hypothetical protein
LPLTSAFLAEWFNRSRENGNGEGDESAGEDTSAMLEYVSASFRVVRHVRPINRVAELLPWNFCDKLAADTPSVT